MTITILEDLGENNEWRWYDITRRDTPEEAIKRYLIENGFEDWASVKITKDPDSSYFICDKYDVRAMTYEI